jgi:hypothetical protein
MADAFTAGQTKASIDVAGGVDETFFLDCVQGLSGEFSVSLSLSDGGVGSRNRVAAKDAPSRVYFVETFGDYRCQN